jgi:ketosteroid isomerase-like protein
MLSANVQVVQRGYDHFNRGDIEGSLATIHPEIEWQTYIVPGPGGGTYHGHDGVRQLWSDARNIFGNFRNEPERIIDVPPDRVVAFIRVCGVGKESGIPVEARIAHLFTIRDGLAFRVRSYEDRDEALRAAGVEAEQA